MDKNVQRLLEEEQQVNKGVQAAIEKKNELMKSIKKESEIAVRNYKKELEHNFEESLNKVRPQIFTNSTCRSRPPSTAKIRVASRVPIWVCSSPSSRPTRRKLLPC